MPNSLGYSQLTYDDILQQVTDKLNADPMFQTFRESAAAKTILDLFAGMTDMINYYIERRAEESYLESARLKSSVIQLAKQIGYVIHRPMPATANISFTIQGGPGLNNIQSGDIISFPLYGSFSYAGNKFILRNTYQYTFTTEDVLNFQDAAYTKTIQFGLKDDANTYYLYKDINDINNAELVTMDVVQGNIAYYEILGDSNDQLGKKFQVYNISDTTFSNIYGSEDYEVPITRIACSDHNYNILNPNAGTPIDTTQYEYSIDRRSLLRNEDIVVTQPQDIVLVKTSINEGIDIAFGDGVYATKGAENGRKKNVWVKYFSTLGGKGNKNGVIGAQLSYDGQIVTSKTHLTITPSITFNFTSNIMGGADIEDNESIKLNAPSIYYALDRVVTSDDYTAFLKTLTSPIKVKNARAWGEQEEIAVRSSETIGSVEKLFNVSLFTVLGEIYKYNSIQDIWTVKESDTSSNGEMQDAVLDSTDLFGGIDPALPDNHYFNVIIRPDSPFLSRTAEVSANSRLKQVYTALGNRSMMTTKNVYVSPIIQEFSLSGTVYCNRLVDITKMKQTIENEIYSFLNEGADFDKPIYLSNLIELIEQNSGVLYANVYLTPTDTGRIELGDGVETFQQAVSGDSIVQTYSHSITSYPPHAATSQLDMDVTIPQNIADVLNVAFQSVFTDWNWAILRQHNDMDNKKQITEFYFWNSFVASMYSRMSGAILLTSSSTLTGKEFINSVQWNELMMRIRNTLYYHIRYNIMRNGTAVSEDIATFSLRNEIPKLTFEAGVVYK